jgi:hypothetical protein
MVKTYNVDSVYSTVHEEHFKLNPKQRNCIQHPIFEFEYTRRPGSVAVSLATEANSIVGIHQV